MPTSQSKPKSLTGEQAESLALDYLQNQGLALVTRNFRCRQGEIDLIMCHMGTTIFVEVRFRRCNTFGSPAESVNRNKRRKLTLCARYYLQKTPEAADRPCRFDVLTIEPKAQDYHYGWVTNAFQMETNPWY